MRPLRSRLVRMRTGLAAAVTSPDNSLSDLVGGRRGLVDALGPHVLFLVVYISSQRLSMAILSALAVCALIAVTRLVARQPLRQIAVGAALVAASGLIARMTGRDVDFYLPEILRTFAMSAVLLLSLAVRRPLVGVLVGPVISGSTWRTDATLLRAYTLCTVIWAGAVVARTAVKFRFYIAEDVVALGVVNLVMGIPLAAVTLYVQLRILRRAHGATPA